MRYAFGVRQPLVRVPRWGAVALALAVLIAPPASPAAGAAERAERAATAPLGIITPADFLAQLKAFEDKDIQGAIDDANQHNMPAAAKCWTTVQTMKASPLINPLPATVGIFTAVQLLLDANEDLQNVTSLNGPLTALVSACAPVVVMVNHIVLQGALTGGSIAALNPVAGAGITALRALIMAALSVVPK